MPTDDYPRRDRAVLRPPCRRRFVRLDRGLRRRTAGRTGFLAAPDRPAAVVTPVVVVYEVYRALGAARRAMTSRCVRVAEMDETRLAPIDAPAAILAADFSLEHGLPMADALIYAVARLAKSRSRDRGRALPWSQGRASSSRSEAASVRDGRESHGSRGCTVRAALGCVHRPRFGRAHPVVHSLGKPGGRGARGVPAPSRGRQAARRGKSGHRRAGRWITSSRGNPRESATESRPPAAVATVRPRRCGQG